MSWCCRGEYWISRQIVGSFLRGVSIVQICTAVSRLLSRCDVRFVFPPWPECLRVRRLTVFSTFAFGDLTLFKAWWWQLVFVRHVRIVQSTKDLLAHFIKFCFSVVGYGVSRLCFLFSKCVVFFGLRSMSFYGSCSR